MLRELYDVLADNPKCLCIDKEVNTRQPIKQKIYPAAPAVEEETMTPVTDMISNGICRPSNSPWASRVVLVSKRDGSRRFWVGLRELNKVRLRLLFHASSERYSSSDVDILGNRNSRE